MADKKNYSDELIENFKHKYKLEAGDFWELTQKKGTWVINHKACEKIAYIEGYTWVLEVLNFSPDIVIKCTMQTADKTISMQSLGEATPKNTFNQYPYAMAEKRAVDRCILKLANAYGYIYSEDESKEFEQERNVDPKDKIEELKKNSPTSKENANESRDAK